MANEKVPTTTFIVDIASKDIGFVEVEAVAVYNIEGDIIFTDDDGVVKEMIARGQWTRCKARSLVA